jgi:prephenate dehydratase/chorismate mutase/prephenate dehydratase
MSLREIRRQIDMVDSRILKLLNDRMELALMAKKFKAQVEDREREAEVLARIRENVTGLINAGFVERIYLEIINESKNLQHKDFKLIAFRGEHGAYDEVAARDWDPAAIAIPCPELQGVFDGVMSGAYDCAIVPVENTLGGVIAEVNRLMIDTELRVVGAVDLPIRFNLMVLPGTEHREIRDVYSHPQVLAQCRQFLLRHKLEPVPYPDTAGAARMLAEKKLKSAGAIGSRLSAELYNLDIVKEDIGGLNKNTTRYLVLSKEAQREDGHKCSVVFSTEHKAGTLYEVLEIFAREGLNLTRIESMPDERDVYVFFLDFMGTDRDERVAMALKEVESSTTRFKLLGCYKEKKASDQ